LLGERPLPPSKEVPPSRRPTASRFPPANGGGGGGVVREDVLSGDDFFALLGEGVGLLGVAENDTCDGFFGNERCCGCFMLDFGGVARGIEDCLLSVSTSIGTLPMSTSIEVARRLPFLCSAGSVWMEGLNVPKNQSQTKIKTTSVYLSAQ